VWEVRVYLGTDPITGKKRYRSRTVRGGRREAERIVAEMIVARKDGSTTGSAATVGQLMGRWVEEARARVTPTTLSVYAATAKRIGTTSLARVPLAKVTAHDVDVAYGELRTAGTTDHVMVQVHRYLSAALTTAVRWGWMAASPMPRVRPPRKPVTTPKDMATDDVAALVRSLEEDDPDLAVAIVVAATVGLRRGEVCALRWSDIDAAGALTVRRSHAMADGRVVVGPPKARHASDAPEVVPIAGETLEALAMLRALQLERAETVNAPVPADGYVLSADGMGNVPRRPDRFGREVREAGRRIGVDASPHRLRHFMASRLVGEGVDIATVSTRMRHRDTALTLRSYVHDDGGRGAEAAALMGRILGPGTR